MDREQQQDRRQFLGASEVVAVDDCTQCVGWMHGGCVDPESGRGILNDDTTPCNRARRKE